MADTYRVYARWPGQQVSDKTTTESEELARLAYRMLVDRNWKSGKPEGVALTLNGKQVEYHDFGDEEKP